jgi:branched-chain amino acid transport system permease protein
VLTPLEEFTRAFVRQPPEFLSFIEGRAGVDVMIFGVIVILVVIFMPDGIVGSFPNWIERLRKRVRNGRSTNTREATTP